MKDQLTIVIPCKNEKGVLVETLDFIKNQVGSEGIRIIIADCSTDNTRSLVNFYNQFAQLNIEFIEGGYPAVARNNGAKLVKTPYVLFLDADINLIDPFHLSNSLEIITSKRGHLLTCKLSSEDEYSIVFSSFFFIQKIVSLFSPIAIGGFMLFKTTEFRKLKGFDERDKFAEDYHLSSKIRPNKFFIQNKTALTTSRRFKKKGLFYMIKMAVLSVMNRNKQEFFHSEYDYWK
jgi:glycosyltransferase involved in cell wall biosynthesis